MVNSTGGLSPIGMKLGIAHSYQNHTIHNSNHMIRTVSEDRFESYVQIVFEKKSSDLDDSVWEGK